MTTCVTTGGRPVDLAAAQLELRRRAQDCIERRRAESDAPPWTVVVHDTPTTLKDPDVRTAVERLAMQGRRCNISVELRGPTLLPTLEQISTCLRTLVACSPTVYWRCLRPLLTHKHRHLEPGVTRLVHADPRAMLMLGLADTGVFADWHPDRSWIWVQFPGQDRVSSMLARHLLVEITPAELDGDARHWPHLNPDLALYDDVDRAALR